MAINQTVAFMEAAETTVSTTTRTPPVIEVDSSLIKTFAVISVNTLPVVLLWHLLQLFLAALLKRYPKPRKLALYLSYLPLETVMFLLICALFLPSLISDLLTTNKLPIPSLDTGKLIFGLMTAFSAFYTWEIVYLHEDIDKFLRIHHLVVVTLLATAGIVSSETHSPLVAAMVINTGGCLILHAAVDFVPHLYLALRRFTSPTHWFTRFLCHLSAWPVTLLRLAANALCIWVLHRFWSMVGRIPEESGGVKGLCGYYWTAFVGSMVLILGVTQAWSHHVYVQLSKKD